MRQTFDLHTHTAFSDGKNTPDEMVRKAIKRGFSCFGISDHSETPFDPPGGMPEGAAPVYRDAVNALKEKYRGQLDLKLGLEQDYFSPDCDYQYDYVIGSVHYLLYRGHYIPVDDTPELFASGVERYFGGDFLKACECFFELESDVANKTGCDIIGHFDLITKFNEKYRFFDTEASRYKTAWTKALDVLLPLNIPFEINTGGISKGWTSFPYPGREIIDYICERGGKLLLSDDAHTADAIGFGFDRYSELIPEQNLFKPAKE